MENLCADAKSFFECWCANWQYHELLNVNVVVGMCPTVDDVHHWNWKCFGIESTKVNVQWHVQSVSRCASNSHGNS
ncbi:hypothetical protein D3C85_1544770 [compost metagenome]